MIADDDKKRRQEQMKQNLYSFTDDDSYDPWDTYINTTAKNAARNSMKLYAAIAGDDQQFASILEKSVRYADYPIDRAYRYDDEVLLLRDILSGLPAYSAQLAVQEQKLAEAAERLSSAGRSPREQKSEDLKYVGLREILTDRKIVISVIELWISGMVSGALELSETEDGGTFIDAVSSFVSYGSGRDGSELPLFPHEPLSEDVSAVPGDRPELLLALASAARLYPRYVKSMFRDNGDGSVTVRLWKDDGGSLSPLYVRLDKNDIYDIHIAQGSGQCLWTDAAILAFESSGLDDGSFGAGKFLRCCFGSDFPAEDKTDDLLSSREDALQRETLFEDILSCSRQGSPMFAVSAGDSDLGLHGCFEIVGAYRSYDYPRRSVVRLRSLSDVYYTALGSGDRLHDIEFERFCGAFSSLTVNRVDPKIKHIDTIGFDIIGEDAEQLYHDRIVSERSFKSYMHCAQDIYRTLLASSVPGEEASQAFTDLVSASREVLGVVSNACGTDFKYVDRVFALIKKSADAYRSAVSRSSEPNAAQRLAVCGAVDAIREMFDDGCGRLDPQREFVHRYARKFAELCIEQLHKPCTPELLAYKTEMLMDDKAFSAAIRKLPVSALNEASPRQLNATFEAYRKLLQDPENT